MNKVRLSYCCINTTLKKQGIYTNRTCSRKVFQQKGIEHIVKLAQQNCRDLLSVLKWNLEHKIYVFRISSDLLPRFTELSVSHQDYVIESVRDILYECGTFVLEQKMRVSFHPGHFCVLASDNPKVVENSINELEYHALIFMLMGLPPSFKYPINIHINTTKGGKEEAANRFIYQWKLLCTALQKSLVIENDDKKNGFTVQELYELIHCEIGIPITFDYYHHKLNSSYDTECIAFQIAYSTWEEERPLFHYSSSKRQEQNDPKIKIEAHSDYILEEILVYKSCDIDIEAKAKEQAVLSYLTKFNI